MSEERALYDDQVTAIAELEELDDVVPAEETEIMNHVQANRAVRLLLGLEREIELITDQEADEVQALESRISEIRARAATMRSGPEGRLEYLKAALKPHLERFAEAELQGKKARSVKLINGRIGFKKGSDKVIVFDDDRAMAWAKTNCPYAIKTAVSILLTPIKEHIKATGEILEDRGIKYIKGEDSFFVETLGGGN